jgi:hypothetical protein
MGNDLDRASERIFARLSQPLALPISRLSATPRLTCACESNRNLTLYIKMSKPSDKPGSLRERDEKENCLAGNIHFTSEVRRKSTSTLGRP